MKFAHIFAVTAIFCFTIVQQTQAAKILSVFPYPGPSHYFVGSALLKGLAKQGHEITSISVYPQTTPLENFRDVAILENADLTKDFMTDTKGMKNKGFMKQINVLYEVGLKMCANVLENSEVKELLSSPNGKFDLIIMENFVTESLFGLAQHFDAPIIGVSTFGTIGFIDAIVGNTSPISYVPHLILAFNTNMNFWQRLINLSINIFDYVHYNFWYLPQQKTLYDHYFPNAKVPFDVQLKNFSLVLLNQHFSVSFARPYVSNMIEVGGLHIKQDPDPLPQDLQVLLDDATEGAIYFSMGSNMMSKDLPAEKIQIFLNTFRSMKIKVLWKFEDAELPNKPENVFISTWYPQASILAHPNVKLFISHGGLLSTTEAIFYAKPVLGLPMFADQPKNIQGAVRAGYALGVNFKNLTEEKFKESLNDILNNQKYTKTVQTLSKRFRDQPIKPLDTAIYWVEYVLRHEGASHLRNAGQDLAFWQYHSLDTIVVLFGGLMVFAHLSVLALKKCFLFCFAKITKVKTN